MGDGRFYLLPYRGAFVRARKESGGRWSQEWCARCARALITVFALGSKFETSTGEYRVSYRLRSERLEAVEDFHPAQNKFFKIQMLKDKSNENYKLAQTPENSHIRDARRTRGDSFSWGSNCARQNK